ncbi:coiled-coil and C2 domain-containing protein 1-like isoform X2 [Atheta coriaria]|uniref:coiled-coil and C2 domain-containing protein 1-like isoform X2 n=1 Tax=Dalotia coriaria TaxID=877792 RepID=UPI0031F3EBDC
MFSKKKPDKPKPRRNQGNLSQYGLFDVPTTLDFNDDNEGDDDNDSDLEAELAALAGGGGKPKRPARKPQPAVNLDAMVQDSMRDIPSDEELSGDDDDPDLLNELSEITGDAGEVEASPQESPTKSTPATVDVGKLLDERMKMYELAEKNAKEAGETSRARRFNRGLKTIKDLIKQNNAGRAINDEDIPPAVTVNIQKRDPPLEPAPSEEVAVVNPPPREEPAEESTPSPQEMVLSEEKQNLLKLLNERKNQYKMAALAAKKSGDTQTAVGHIKIVKQFETVIKAVESGQEVDLSRMPGPPVNEKPNIEEAQPVQHAEEPMAVPEESPEEAPQLISANSVGEALEQRLAVYKEQENNAKEQGNSSKARRMGRIVKQFEQAIKAHKSGKSVAFDELPTPPGYAPIPGTEKPVEASPVVPNPNPAPAVPKPSPQSPPANSSSGTTPPAVPARTRAGNKQPTTRMEKQLTLLKQRQNEFKVAALNAKKKGELNEAKEYLRTAKGFDPLIEAAEGGLPVDITSLPIPPMAKAQLDVEYELVMADECTEEDDSVLDVISRLESQLTKQLKTCLSTRDHFKAIGDIAGMNRFEHLALTVTKDLDVVRIAKRTNSSAIPKFHYEKRDYSIVKSFTDLNDNDLELLIARGINYNCANPKDIDTYVKFEFPNPNDEIYRDKTATVKDTNNPEYNSQYSLSFQRGARPWMRIFKRHAIKFEVYSKGGFLRSDTLLGTVTVKLQPLETQCEIHDSFDLMDGRKKVGGKLEVRLRLRDPLLNREVQQLSERWLVVDS